MQSDCQKALADAFDIIDKRQTYQYVLNNLNGDEKRAKISER